VGDDAFRDLPEGYVEVARGGWRVAVREDFAAAFDSDSMANPERLAASGQAVFRGRGRPSRVALPDGAPGVLRGYRHGGMFRALTGRRFTGTPRPLVELVATERARAGGVRAPEILAAYVRRVTLVCHVGYLLTREIPGAVDLMTLIESGMATRGVFRRLGAETARMHAAGVRHADLHVKNVLVTGGEVTIIDFDRARVFDEVPREDRVGNLLRFDRSVVKLGRKGVRVPMKDRLRFFHGYRTEPVTRRERADVIRRCERSLSVHRKGWAIFGTGH